MRQVLLVLIVLVLGCSDNKSETDDVSKVEVDNETILNEIKNKLSGLWVIERGHLDYMAVVIDENFLTITTEPNNFLRVHEF